MHLVLSEWKNNVDTIRITTEKNFVRALAK